ncbi:hypothetical protein GGR92_002331 [Spirosoma lacussanchae]|uniref:polysaccharide pyruvyl transferase family protein n=1 Tax=Spirosoma lacussanchae TaxID=1884249 RepID=UPI001109218D|nr:polysaccharide pyruvyl transferase family protein [Spirosoma lacussanchae]
MNKKVLIAGWFSFEHGHPTAGDIMALNSTTAWVEEAGLPYDVAFDPPFTGGVNWRTVEPTWYSHVVFVCGPFEQGNYEADFLSRFTNCRLIGLNLSMLVPLNRWNPFDLLLERNSTATVRPDIVFLAREPLVPVIGICLVEPYPGALDAVANQAINRLISTRHVAVVYIDTRLDTNSTHLRTPAEVESLIARVDVLVTTRLHGMVMALKNNVPVLAIDPEAGGAKIVAQAQKIGWPVVFQADALDDHELNNAFDYCLTEQARKKALACKHQAIEMAEQIHAELVLALTHSESLENTYRSRINNPENNAWTKGLLSKQKTEPYWLRKAKADIKKTAKAVLYWSLPTPFYNSIARTKNPFR